MTIENANQEETASGRRRPWTKPSLAQRKRMLRIEGWIAIAATYVLLIFAYTVPTDYLSTSTPYIWVSWSAFIVRTFLFHGGLLIAAIAIAAAIGRCRTMMVATLPLLAITLGPFLLSYLPKSVAHASAEGFTVMSINLLMINEEVDSMITEVRNVDPDILLLQEYAHHWHDAFQNRLADDFPHRVFLPRDDSFGAAVYSKHPFAGKPTKYLPLGQASEPQMRAVITIGGTNVAVYNIHLLPPWGLEYIREHRAQYADLLRLLKDEQLPIVLAGDFNFTETAPQASDLGRIGLADSQSIAGIGRGATWPANGLFRWVPKIRLDHIYLRGLSCVECCRGMGKGSDHLPVIVRISLDGSAGNGEAAM